MKFTFTNLKALDPCSEALDWAETQKTASEAWKNCERGDWLLWLLRRIQPLTKSESVTLACRFALEVLRIFETEHPKDKRPRLAIEAAQAWVKTPTDVTKNAESAARSAAWSAAESAAWSAESAESAARSAAWSAAESAESAAWKQQANIIREIIPNPFKSETK